MSSAFPSEVRQTDLDMMIRQAGESFAFETDDDDEPMQPVVESSDWGWRFVGLLLACFVFAAAVLTIR